MQGVEIQWASKQAYFAQSNKIQLHSIHYVEAFHSALSSYLEAFHSALSSYLRDWYPSLYLFESCLSTWKKMSDGPLK